MRNNNRNTKNFNSNHTTTIVSSFKSCIILFMIVIVATGPISALNLPVVDKASAQQQQVSKDRANNESVTLENNKNVIKDNKKEVFHICILYLHHLLKVMIFHHHHLIIKLATILCTRLKW